MIARIPISDPQAPPEDKAFEIRCPYCNTVVRVTFDDYVCDACGAGTIDGVWIEPELA